MPDPAITISSPADGATVGRPFTANGTYTFDNPFPPITVVLKDSTGAVVATGQGLLIGGGTWSCGINPTQPYTDASVYAEITNTAANDTTTNITVT